MVLVHSIVELLEYGMVWYGTEYGMVWYGYRIIRYGMERYGKVR